MRLWRITVLRASRAPSSVSVVSARNSPASPFSSTTLWLSTLRTERSSAMPHLPFLSAVTPCTRSRSVPVAHSPLPVKPRSVNERTVTPRRGTFSVAGHADAVPRLGAGARSASVPGTRTVSGTRTVRWAPEPRRVTSDVVRSTLSL
ncbi:hypothetical protein SHIRM173S_06400 [Streptomyces hirsutus]